MTVRCEAAHAPAVRMRVSAAWSWPRFLQLVGERLHAADALAAATRVFRAVSFEQLSSSDFDSNAAASDLNAKARAAKLGEIDFFISHVSNQCPVTL